MANADRWGNIGLKHSRELGLHGYNDMTSKSTCTACLKLHNRLRKAADLSHRHQGRADCNPRGA